MNEFDDLAEATVPGLAAITPDSHQHAYLVSARQPQSRRYITGNIVSRLSARAEFVQSEDSASISIDQIRRLYSLTSRRKTIDEPMLAVVIPDAQNLTLPAQNALLKLLEEPPRGVVFILTSQRKDALLPTIRSRCVHLRTRPLTQTMFVSALERHGIDAQTAVGLFYICGGDPLCAVLDTAGPQRAEILAVAKRIFQESIGDAVIAAQVYAKNRNDAGLFIESLLLIAGSAFRGTKSIEIKRVWSRRVEAILEARSQAESSINVKLLLSRLVIDLRVS